VDLPGYGFEQVSKDKRENFEKFITDYILKRENLLCVFVLIDSRLKPQKIDLEFMSWLGEKQIPFAMAFTKIDKLGKKQFADNIDFYKAEMLKYWEELPPLFFTSAEKKIGKAEILKLIEETNLAYK